MLNFNALEGLRRAFVAAIKSIELVCKGVARHHRLATFLQEVRRRSLQRSRKSLARLIATVCACSKRPTCVVCAFAPCSSPD